MNLRPSPRLARRAVVAIVVVAASTFSVSATQAASTTRIRPVIDKPIQPGAPICGADDIVSTLATLPSCDVEGTLSFVFRDDDGALYVGTAAHNVPTDGAVYVPECPDCRDGLEGSPFGDVFFSSDSADFAHPTSDAPDDDLLDFALIKIRPAWYRHVEPAVRHWGGPVEVIDGSDTAAGDDVVAYGNGHGQTFDTCEPVSVLGNGSQPGPRGPGQLIAASHTSFASTTCEVGGDSGMPYLHAASGMALGVNGNCACGTSGYYPTVAGVLDVVADEKKLVLRVVTAPPSPALADLMDS